jgi:glucose-1-phosphate adenylyltransferase
MVDQLRTRAGDRRQTDALTELAAGMGTRLGALCRRRVKPAVPFGGCFRLIDFPLSNCVNSGIRRIGVLTQYMAHSLVQHIQQGWTFFRAELGEYIALIPAQQRKGEHWYLGTADAVYQNTDIIRRTGAQFVLVLGGDHVYKMDYGEMIAFHAEHGAGVTVGCRPVPRMEATEFGVMAVDESWKVVGFDEKPADPKPMPGNPDLALASMGIYVFDREYLLEMLEEDADDPASQHDFGKNIIPRACAAGEAYGFPFRDPVSAGPAYWRDVGSVDSYWQANLELLDVQPELNLYDRDWPIWTRHRHEPPAKFVFDEDGHRGTALSSMVAGGCIVSGAMVRHSLLYSFVTVEERSVVEDSVVLARAHIGRGCRIRRAIIDADCQIPDGTTIGYDGAQDRERFEVSERGVVLVTRDMLGQDLHDD